jgi:hypothetical protein
VPPETVALLLVADHDPPVTVAVSEMDEPAHTVVVPLIVPAEGATPMVTTWLAIDVPQLLVTVYTTVSVPVDTPLTSPVGDTDAVPFVVLQVPPVPVVVSVVVSETQIADAPLMIPALGAATTVATLFADWVPQVLVTV